MSKFSVKRPYLVLVVVLALTVLGVVGFTRMTTDFLPEMEFPALLVITTYPGASPQRVETELTDPLEGGLATVNGVTEVASTSSENYSQITLRFENGTNMDSAMVKVTSAINQVTMPEEVGEPIIIEMSADMIPTLYTGVSYKGHSGSELTEFINENIIPELKRQEGVASISSSGLIEDSVEVRLNQKKIDKVNEKVFGYTEDKLDEAGDKIYDAKSKLNSAESKLTAQESSLSAAQDSSTKELAEASKAVDAAIANKAAYDADYNSLKVSKKALEGELAAYNNALDQIPDEVRQALNSKESYDQFKAAIEMQKQMGLEVDVDIKQLDKLYDIVNTRIPQIDTELANLKTKMAAQKALKDTIDKAVKEAEANYATLEQGKMTAAAAFGSGTAQIAAGKQQIKDGKKELDDAAKDFEKSKKKALDNANIDALLTMETLSQLLAAQNFAMPAGYINSEKTQYLLKVDEAMKKMNDVKNTPLTYIKGYGKVRVKDVADITIIDNSDDVYAKMNGDDAAVLAIYKTSTAGTTSVSTDVQKKMKELEKDYEGLSFVQLSDQGDYIRIVISSVFSNLIWGAVLAILVLLVFLRDIRPTVVVAFSIPLSVLFAMLTMYFTDITLNIISLSGLALGIGMLVDNSIVVIENIYRLRGKGVPAARAAVMGANQVAGAIFSSTLTTVCVFLPIVFTDGLSRQIIQDMCLTITYSLLASLLVALTVVPTLGSTLLKNDKGREHRLFDRIMDIYEVGLRFCLKVKIVPIAISIGLFVLCAIRVFSTGIVIVPEMDSYQMQAELNMNPDLEDSDAHKTADEITDKFMKIEGVETVGTIPAASLGMGSTDTSQYQIMILLDHEYATQNKQIAEKMRRIVEDKKYKDSINEATVSESSMDMGSVLGNGLQVDINGADDQKLLKISKDIMNMAKQIKGFTEIENGQEAADTELILDVDKNKAIKKNLTVGQIYQQVYGKLSDTKSATQVTMDEKDYDVKIVDERDELTKENLLDYKIETTKMKDDGTEEKVKYKLGDFAKIKEQEAFRSIKHADGSTQISVTAQVEDGYNTTLLSRKLQEKLDKYDTPDGYKIAISGETETVNDMVKNMLLMMAVAIALIYLIMVGQFANFLSPFIVMFTIPLAFTGGFLALMISGEPLSMLAMMGFLILAGVVVNNGIVFIDYANRLRREGEDKLEALVETGRTRMRPILMTTMTTVLGMSVMAFGKGEAAALGRGMALVTIGGLLYATFMTLFFVPTLYDLFYRKDLKNIDLGDEESLNDMDI